MKKIIISMLATVLFYGCTQSAEPASSVAAGSSVPSSVSSGEGEVSKNAAKPEKGEDQKGEKRQEKEFHTTMGVVTAVEGNTITIETMRGGFGDGKGGRDPSNTSKPNGTASNEKGAPPDSNTQNGSVSNGSTPDGGQRPDGQTPPQGETLTLTLADTCEILLQGTDKTTTAGTISEIIADTMISYTYGEDGQTVASVTILSKEIPSEPASSDGQ